MTKVAEVALKAARHCTDVLYGTATGGSTTTLADTNNLVQESEYFKGGTLWILSGTHAGKVFIVTDHAEKTLTFASVTGAIAAGVRYAVARKVFPFSQLMGAMQQALDETWVTGHDNSLTGDGETLVFTLPEGVRDVKEVRIEYPTTSQGDTISNHWSEVLGDLVFDAGYAPYDDHNIHLYWKKEHDELTGYDSVIHDEISLKWLYLKTAHYALMWGLDMYGENNPYMIETKINTLLNMGVMKKPRRVGGVQVVMRSGGSGE